MIKRALMSVGIAVGFVAFMVACIAVNLLIQGDLQLDLTLPFGQPTL